jgi:hypothetical protein
MRPAEGGRLDAKQAYIAIVAVPGYLAPYRFIKKRTGTR